MSIRWKSCSWRCNRNRLSIKGSAPGRLPRDQPRPDHQHCSGRVRQPARWSLSVPDNTVDPNLKPKLNYDPETSKKLLTQAGYPNGVDVELQTPVGRYTLDKQLTEAMIPMLNAGGFRAKLLTPEWPTFGPMSRKEPFPSIIWAEARSKIRARRCTSTFLTGETPPHRYSNPKLDELLDKEVLKSEEATTIPV